MQVPANTEAFLSPHARATTFSNQLRSLAFPSTIFVSSWTASLALGDTPKSGTTSGSVGHWGIAAKRLPGYVIGTLLLIPVCLALVVFSLVAGHYLAAIFYVTQIVGNSWVGLALLREFRPRWFAWVPPGVRLLVRRVAMSF